MPGTNLLQTKDGPEYLTVQNHTSPPPSLAELPSSDQVFPCPWSRLNPQPTLDTEPCNIHVTGQECLLRSFEFCPFCLLVDHFCLGSQALLPAVTLLNHLEIQQELS